MTAKQIPLRLQKSLYARTSAAIASLLVIIAYCFSAGVGNLPRAKNKLCKMWRAVLIYANNSVHFVVYGDNFCNFNQINS